MFKKYLPMLVSLLVVLGLGYLLSIVYCVLITGAFPNLVVNESYLKALLFVVIFSSINRKR